MDLCPYKRVSFQPRSVVL